MSGIKRITKESLAADKTVKYDYTNDTTEYTCIVGYEGLRRNKQNSVISILPYSFRKGDIFKRHQVPQLNNINWVKN